MANIDLTDKATMEDHLTLNLQKLDFFSTYLKCVLVRFESWDLKTSKSTQKYGGSFTWKYMPVNAQQERVNKYNNNCCKSEEI